MTRKALFIINPVSGRAAHGLTRARCLEAMTEGGLSVEVIETAGPAQVARLVAEDRGGGFRNAHRRRR